MTAKTVSRVNDKAADTVTTTSSHTMCNVKCIVFQIPAKLHTDSISRSGTPGLLIHQRWEVANYNLVARAVTPLTISSVFMPVSVRPWNTNSKQPIPDARHRRHSAAVAALIEPSPSPALLQSFNKQSSPWQTHSLSSPSKLQPRKAFRTTYAGSNFKVFVFNTVWASFGRGWSEFRTAQQQMPFTKPVMWQPRGQGGDRRPTSWSDGFINWFTMPVVYPFSAFTAVDMGRWRTNTAWKLLVVLSAGTVLNDFRPGPN